MAAYFEKRLLDVAENVFEETYELDCEGFAGYEGPPWRIAKFRLRGGRQDGVDLVEIDNGVMTVVVVPTRGMNVLEACTDEVSLGWNSPVREVVNPAYVRLQERGGTGWLTGFNELMCRCGLAYHGAPGEDVGPGEGGLEKRVQCTLHGTISNVPAMRVTVRVQLQPPYELAVIGEVQDTVMFGPSYGLRATVATLPGTREFTVSDVVRNLGGTPAELELLYHCNYGTPLLGDGARMVAPVQFCCPHNERAQEGIEHWDLCGPPEPGFVEQVYFLRLHGDRDGRTLVGLVDAQETLAATIRYSVERLPAFTIWKNTAAECDGYVTGLE
ncbi:MAG: DUF4432 family protein, partial [Planctomycetota bacterium]